MLQQQQQQQAYLHSHLSSYGSNLVAPPQPPQTNQMDGYFSANMMLPNRKLSAQVDSDQQLAHMFRSHSQQYPVPPPPVQMLNAGRAFGEMYNDEGSNIYTEPTLLDHDLAPHSKSEPGMVISALGAISTPLPPPPPPPPIFTASFIEEATAAASSSAMNSAFPSCSNVTRKSNHFSHHREPAGKVADDEFSFVDMITSQSCESVAQQTNRSRLTITGQDLEITLNNNGEMTQTVISSQAKQTVNAGSVANHAVTSNGASAAATAGNPHLLYYYSNQRIEFLPLCDLLFNIISLAAYFCDVVFDSVTAYTLYLNEQFLWLVLALLLIFTSAILSQLLSYKWYLREKRFREQMRYLHRREWSAAAGAEDVSGGREQAEDVDAILTSPYEVQSPLALALTHLCLCGVLLRYFKLFVPVNLSTVKREVRDLCVLRMVHGFCQAGPMLLLQVYLVWMKPADAVTDLNIISIFLSLFSLCWALSSFSKNIRQCQIHKLVLTWLGVIFQFFWRIGTVTSRIVALTIYATVYQQWIFVVLLLHWFSMFLWLSTPNINAVHSNIIEDGASANQKKQTKKERIRQNALVAWVYLFCFINLENTNPRYKMIVFYLIMFMENVLLLSISTFFGNHLFVPWYRSLAHYLVFGSFFFGIFFMFLYYRFFHIRHLKHTLDGIEVEATLNGNNRLNYAGCQNDAVGQGILVDGELFSCEQKQSSGQKQASYNGNGQWTKASPWSRLVNALSNQIFPGCYHTPAQLSTPSGRHHFNNDTIPGVFNCRLNPALKRKKKIPSTIPPPPIATANSVVTGGDSLMTGVQQQRAPLETIDEVLPMSMHQQTMADSAGSALIKITAENGNLSGHAFSAVQRAAGSQHHRRSMVHGQPQRPSTNTSILTRHMHQAGTDTFWRKSALSARSLSISPSAMLKSAECSFRMPPKHPFSSTLTTPTSPAHFMPTENFTDKLEVCIEQNESNNSREGRPTSESLTTKNPIIRPKPITLDAVNDFLDYANPERMMQQQQQYQQGEQQLTGTLVQYYYNPQTGKMTLRSQTPEVLLHPHTDNSSRIFYDYPSTVISMQRAAETEQRMMMASGEDEDLIFTRQCQRPPVPGREGDDKSEELNDTNDNVSYVEGKRSLLNYGLSRSRLEKILEKKQEEANSHKAQFAYTLPSELKASTGKSGAAKQAQSRYASGQLKKKKKYTCKSKKNKSRSSMRTISQHSIHSSDSRSSSPTDDSLSHCSSGEDGDIESDINQHERAAMSVMRPSTMRDLSRAQLRTQNVYDHVSPPSLCEQSFDQVAQVNSTADEMENRRAPRSLFKPVSPTTNGDCMTTAEVHHQHSFQEGPTTTSGERQVPRIIRGPIQQNSNTVASHATAFGGHKIANYHMASEQQQRPQAGQSSKRANGVPVGTAVGRPKPLYNSAKYKRHNTPL